MSNVIKILFFDVPTHALGHHGTALINHTPMKTTRVDVSVDVPTHVVVLPLLP